MYLSWAGPWDISLMETYQLSGMLQKSASFPKSEWGELILSFPHTYYYSRHTYHGVCIGIEKTHNHYTLETARSIFCLFMTRLCRFLERCQISLQQAALWLRQRNELSPSEHRTLAAKQHLDITFSLSLDYSIALDLHLIDPSKFDCSSRYMRELLRKETPPGH